MSVRSLFFGISITIFSLAAQASNLTKSYITGIDPTKLAQAEVRYEKAIGEKIDWLYF